jgi:hypothetical protein
VTSEASIALAIVILFTLLFALPANSASKTIKTPIYGVLTASSKYGSCMVQVGALPRNTLDCKTNGDRTWVTLDCDGNFGNRASSQNSLSMAKMALLTRDLVNITIEDNRRIGGYCFGSQIILFR